MAGTQALIGALEDTSANLQEAAADAVCKMATSVQNRTSLVNKVRAIRQQN